MSMQRITHIVIHYSATFEDQDITAADIDKMHKARGWKGIGYHWFIRRDGTVEIGRPESQVGAHVGGQNSGKIGICCAGGLNRATGASRGVDNRTAAQVNAMTILIRGILRRHPGAKVVGHRDLAATQCPGFDAASWWAKVDKLPAPEPTVVKPSDPVKTPDVGEDRFHVVDEGDTWWSIAQEHGLSLPDLYALNSSSNYRTLYEGERIRVYDAPDAPSVAPKEHWLTRLIKAFLGGKGK
jgi:N-acetylmuramoyl-L-alanine amidase